MVAAARKEREAADRRSDQLRAQLNDTELLLVSHQEQLAELKTAMHQMSVDREEAKTNATHSTAPSSPAMHMPETMNRYVEAQNLSPASCPPEDVTPAPPTSFTHMFHPVLRNDIQAFDDFHTLLLTSRKSSPNSRVSSGSFGTLNVHVLGHRPSREQLNINGRMASTGSTSSFSTSASQVSSPAAPSSTNSSVSSRDNPIIGVALKETRFYKRALTECIEPTLRLDTAPGLSWLARRTVISSMAEGGLVVEPMPAGIKHNIFACSLCGENRQDEEHARSHRFRTSENDNAQRYPLCGFCLTRVRASCDFLGFLRMLKDGHWRANDDEAELQAWEECVRLQERMFWARIGGGVVPIVSRVREPMPSTIEQDLSTASLGGQVPEDLDRDIQPHSEEKDNGSLGVEKIRPQSVTSAYSNQERPTSSDNVAQHPISPSPVATAPVGEPGTIAEPTIVTAPKDVPNGLGIEDAQFSPRAAVRESVIMPGAFE